jgi:hypothetical protein
MRTLYDIEVNPGLLWDCDYTHETVTTEEFLTFYLGRVLERGTAREVKQIPTDVIRNYLDRLTIPNRVRKFWEWYLSSS